VIWSKVAFWSTPAVGVVCGAPTRTARPISERPIGTKLAGTMPPSSDSVVISSKGNAITSARGLAVWGNAAQIRQVVLRGQSEDRRPILYHQVRWPWSGAGGRPGDRPPAAAPSIW